MESAMVMTCNNLVFRAKLDNARWLDIVYERIVDWLYVPATEETGGYMDVRYTVQDGMTPAVARFYEKDNPELDWPWAAQPLTDTELEDLWK